MSARSARIFAGAARPSRSIRWWARAWRRPDRRDRDGGRQGEEAEFEPTVGSVAGAKLRVRAEKEGVIVRSCQCGDTIAVLSAADHHRGRGRRDARPRRPGARRTDRAVAARADRGRALGGRCGDGCCRRRPLSLWLAPARGRAAGARQFRRAEGQCRDHRPARPARA